MTVPEVPPNLRYHRRFDDPGSRPSNRRVDPLEEATRWQVEQVARFIDELEAERTRLVVAAAEAILRGDGPTTRVGDPGE